MTALVDLAHQGILRNCPAPAKLNLFLHVIGQRTDGYHLLQSVFQLIDRGDLLHFRLRSDRKIQRTNPLAGVPSVSDLVVRAARLLQQYTNNPFGVDITLDKHLPMGGGLGGGSSDAATTLIALNYLWNTHLSRQQLIQLGMQLGADVPFFLFGQNAFVEGIGEQLTPVETPDCWYVVIEPGVSVPTEAIFSSKALTRNSPSIKVADFRNYLPSNKRGKNDLQYVAVQLFPEILAALNWLNSYGNARMTGSGSCVFCACSNEEEANVILQQVDLESDKAAKNWKVWKSKALKTHPLVGLVK